MFIQKSPLALLYSFSQLVCKIKEKRKEKKNQYTLYLKFRQNVPRPLLDEMEAQPTPLGLILESLSIVQRQKVALQYVKEASFMCFWCKRWADSSWNPVWAFGLACNLVSTYD